MHLPHELELTPPNPIVIPKAHPLHLISLIWFRWGVRAVDTTCQMSLEVFWMALTLLRDLQKIDALNAG